MLFVVVPAVAPSDRTKTPSNAEGLINLLKYEKSNGRIVAN